MAMRLKNATQMLSLRTKVKLKSVVFALPPVRALVCNSIFIAVVYASKWYQPVNLSNVVARDVFVATYVFKLSV